MALAPFMVITFLVCLVVAYLYMTIKCFAQKRYSSAANLILRMFANITCEPCRESCDNHKKLIAGAILFSLLMAIVLTLTVYLAITYSAR